MPPARGPGWSGESRPWLLIPGLSKADVRGFLDRQPELAPGSPEFFPYRRVSCHPSAYDCWLFMHNGYIDSFATIKRALVFAVDPSL